MKWFRNAALVALLCLSLMGSALATEPAADASMGSEIPVTEDVSSPEESSVEETSGEETADAEESTDTEESIDTGLTDEDISWLMESSDSVTMGYSTYFVDDSEVSYEENTMGDVIVSIFGVYQPKTQTVTDHIDKIIYDESTKSYHIDSHDTYNYEYNYYYTWNYYINYTSITYIGQTEEYNKYYEVYYELPDGRDSADLTKEEVEQLNVSVDVIPYGRSADDTSLRSLYHFDGDTRDSSYWNYCTDFTWNKGASLTYMDAGVFDGALYLGETEHDFTITLPSTLSQGDFTIQWRYYQSYTAAPVTDSYIYSGGAKLMAMSGSYFYNASGRAVVATPIGTWNEIAITRSGNLLYYYLNGVCAGACSFASTLGKDIQFVFGSSQQTYKYFDELRVLNYAIAAGDNYTPTAVPHDTNLALVLPDSAVPVADEYWSVTSSGENLFQYDMNSSETQSFQKITTMQEVGYVNYYTGAESISNKYALAEGSTAFAFPRWGYNQNYMTISQNDGYTTLKTNYSYLFLTYTLYNQNGDLRGLNNYWGGTALATLLSSANSTGGSFTAYLGNGDYILSVVLADGTICSFPFTMSGNKPTVTTTSFDWGTIGVAYGVSYNNQYPAYYLYIQPNTGTSVNIQHIELISGTETDLKAEWVESVTFFDKSSLHTPSLAVRTDLDITSYQIGGVRPSIPTKGQVWAMVENERITSIQIYNGQAWEGVDGRIWTGQRWVPASSYNIVTLQDMYDIVDATQNYEYIYSESGFWSWWQKSWNAFTEKLFSVLGSGGSGGGGSGATGGEGSSNLYDIDLDADIEVIDPDSEDERSFWQFIVLVIAGGKSVVTGTRKLFSGVVSTVSGSMDTIIGAFDTGGYASGMLDGTGSDPDAADMPTDEVQTAAIDDESEVLDPWRYR